MISYARQNPEQQSDETSPPVEDHIAPAPRVSVQAFCETVETAAAVQSAGSYEEAMQQVLELYPAMNMDELALLLENAGLNAGAFGRYTAAGEGT